MTDNSWLIANRVLFECLTEYDSKRRQRPGASQQGNPPISTSKADDLGVGQLPIGGESVCQAVGSDADSAQVLPCGGGGPEGVEERPVPGSVSGEGAGGVRGCQGSPGAGLDDQTRRYLRRN